MTTSGAFIDGLAAARPRASAAVASASDPIVAIDALLDAVDGVASGAAYWAVFLLDHQRLWAVGHRGYTMIPDGLLLDRGIVARAVRTGEPQAVPDVAADPDYLVGTRGMVSELALPIVVGDELVGVLNVETTFRLEPEAAEALAPFTDLIAERLLELRLSPAVDVSSLLRVFVHMSSLREAGAIAELAAQSLAHVLGLEVCEVTFGAEEELRPADWSRTGDALPPGLVDAVRTHVDAASVFDVVDAGEAGLADLVGADRSLVWLPLRVNGEEVGVLVGTVRGAPSFPRSQAEAAALLAAQAAGSIDAALALVRERRTAATDALTGLLNRRGFGDRLERQLEAAAGHRSPLSLLVLDCDEFKAVNDRGGHERGDRVLVELARLIKESLRRDEAAARLGGDEFALMLPGTDAAAAHARADSLRVALARGLAEAGTPLHVSAGLATYPFDGGNGTQLLRAADQGLYAAKSSGKDLVVAFRDLGHWTRRGAAGRVRERRGQLRAVGGGNLAAQLDAITAETGPDRMLLLLCRALTGSLSATAALASRVEGDRLRDLARYALRDIDLGSDASYLLDDFPLTRSVLERGEPLAISFLDDNIDRSEAFVLRELGMSSLLMLPLTVGDRTWGLVEVYDVRLREFEPADVEAATLLTGEACRRLGELSHGGVDIQGFGMGGLAPLQRPLPAVFPAPEGYPRAG